MSGINPNDLVNRLTQQGAKHVASTFGAMQQKTQDQQKIEKQSEHNLLDKIMDKHNQAKELEKNAKNTGIISQSLTNKELNEDDNAIMLDEEYLIEEGAKQQGLLKQHEQLSVDSGEQIELNFVSEAPDKEKKIFSDLASKVGTTPEQIELAARQEVENQLNTNKSEMNQIKLPSETSFIETEIYQDQKPASEYIKESKFIVTDANPLDIEIAEKEF